MKVKRENQQQDLRETTSVTRLCSDKDKGVLLSLSPIPLLLFFFFPFLSASDVVHRRTVDSDSDLVAHDKREI